MCSEILAPKEVVVQLLSFKLWLLARQLVKVLCLPLLVYFSVFIFKPFSFTFSCPWSRLVIFREVLCICAFQLIWYNGVFCLPVSRCGRKGLQLFSPRFQPSMWQTWNKKLPIPSFETMARRKTVSPMSISCPKLYTNLCNVLVRLMKKAWNPTEGRYCKGTTLVKAPHRDGKFYWGGNIHLLQLNVMISDGVTSPNVQNRRAYLG